MNFSCISVPSFYALVLLRLDSVYLQYIRSCFFVVAFIKKTNLAIIIYKVHYLSGNDAKKCYFRCVATEWLLGLHAKRSTVLRITFWDGNLSSQQGVSVNSNPNPKTEFLKKK